MLDLLLRWFFAKPESHQTNLKQLIISSGDISDVDGFFALAEYAKTGADVLYVMNYPAYLDVNPSEAEGDAAYESLHPGLGYKYSAREVLAKDPEPASASYSAIMSRYNEIEENKKVKAAMTDMAYEIAVRVWKECEGAKGRLFFCIGGVNAVNPFSAKVVKNELLVFADCIAPLPERAKWPSADPRAIEAREQIVYDEENSVVEIKWQEYDHIYVDFNGSMAFFSADHWIYKALVDKAVANRIKGAFVMGGVLAEETPKTMPSIQGVLNRFSSATMNQLYHPENSGRFFSFMAERSIPVFTVTNNVVDDLTTWADEEHTLKTYDGVQHFMTANGLKGAFLSKIARAYYENPHGHPPRKAFDFYVAMALRRFCNDGKHELSHTRKNLFYSAGLGVTLVSAANEWPVALDSLKQHIDTSSNNADSPFTVAKKANYAKELETLSKLEKPPLALPVRDLSFSLEGNGLLSVEHTEHTLIVSTGDISDVDGFFALAQYAKTGADVLYIMNYPAYVGVSPADVEPDAEYEQAQPGLGYRYSAKEVLAKLGDHSPQAYADFMRRYESDEKRSDANWLVKTAMTDLAFQLVRRVWAEAAPSSKHLGRLYFCVGGVNSVNPFSRTAVKNELVVFADAADKDGPRLNCEEGEVYDEHAKKVIFNFREYDHVYVDFNGSMAFLGEGSWLFPQLRDVIAAERLRGVFVMGGVQAEEAPRTMPPIAGTLNRLSCATMNQLYHPANTARFFQLVGGAAANPRVYIVTNNVVADLTSWADEEHKTKTYDGVERFLHGHGLGGAYLGRLARSYYECKHGPQPPRKAFDFYTAAVLCSAVAGTVASIPTARKQLFYCSTYGVTLVGGAEGGWKGARDAYLQRVKAASEPTDGDSPFIMAKKASFRDETQRLLGLKALPGIQVLDVKHRINSLLRLSQTSANMAKGMNAVRAMVRLHSIKNLGGKKEASTAPSSA